MNAAAITVLNFFALVMAVATAQATDSTFVGTWGKDAAQCAISQEEQGAPMVFSKGGYDQHEAHCTFKKVSGEGNKWNVSATCSVEGDQQTDEFSLIVKGDTLTTVGEAGTHVLTRCP